MDQECRSKLLQTVLVEILVGGLRQDLDQAGYSHLKAQLGLEDSPPRWLPWLPSNGARCELEALAFQPCEGLTLIKPLRQTLNQVS